MTVEKTVRRNHHTRILPAPIVRTLLFGVTGAATGVLFYDKIYLALQQILSMHLGRYAALRSTDFIFEVSLACGILAAMPAAVYNLPMAFGRRPGRKDKWKMRGIAALSAILVVLGVIAAFRVVLPAMLGLVSQNALIQSEEVAEYSLTLAIVTAALFVMPFILLSVNKVYRLTSRKFYVLTRFAVAVSLVISAVFTPSVNFGNQLLWAAPIMLLYVISAKVVTLANKFRQHKRNEVRDWMNISEEAFETIAQDMSGASDQILGPIPQTEPIPIEDVFPKEGQGVEPQNDLGVRGRGEPSYKSRDIQ